MFIIKCSDKSFEISASDKKKKQEWIQGVSHCSLCYTIKGPSMKNQPCSSCFRNPNVPLPRCLSAIQTCIQQLSLGLSSPHREARLRRRELRQRQQVQVEDLEDRMKQLQAANENKQRQLEEMRKVASSLRSEPLTVGSKRCGVQPPKTAPGGNLKGEGGVRWQRAPH